MNRRTILTVVCGAVLVTSGFVGGWMWRGTSSPEFDSSEQLAQFLKANVADGMTVDQLRMVFGINGSLVDPAYPKSKVAIPILNLYRSRPHGLKENDSFAAISVGNQLVLFQLRDGRVINWCGTDIFMFSAI